MSSYHTSFNYLDQNSAKDHHLLVAAFEPDNGPMDSFLNMEQVYTESSDGTKRNLYGLKYNTVAAVKITLVKPDGSDFSVAENRKILKWLTGNRQASWLDLYEGETLAYSFWGSITTVQQQKLDARVVGIILTFESTTPWAYSAPQDYDCRFGEANLVFGQEVLEDGTKNNFIYKGLDSSVENAKLGIDEDGVLYNDDDDVNATFNIDTDGIIYNGEDIDLQIDNQSDDLYSYINLDMTYTNIGGNESDNTLTIARPPSIGETFNAGNAIIYSDCDGNGGKNQYFINDPIYTVIDEKNNYLQVRHHTMTSDSIGWFKKNDVGEITRITGIKQNEVITISKGQFIASKTDPKRIFGKNFNFVWPRLRPGINEFKINGSGRGSVRFTCRYPIKIGDCAVDINNLINTSICSGCVPSAPSDSNSSSSGGGIVTGSNVENAVLYTAQNLTSSQKVQARTNIGAGTSSFSGSYNDLTNTPKLSDVALSGDYNDLINIPIIPEFTETEIIDNLTSGSTTAALSANQGMVLDNKITALSNAMGEAGYGDMLKATYDADGDGIVDDSEKLGGKLPSYYATASELQTAIDNMPSALKNPYQIIFTGAASGSYDGSAEVTIDIPLTSNSLSMRVSDGYLQYLNISDSAWVNLIKTSDLVSMNIDDDGVVFLG